MSARMLQRSSTSRLDQLSEIRAITRLLPLSLLTLIGIGVVLLKLPHAVQPGQPISGLDALFTITSAVSLTGLIVKDPATAFTGFGQAVIAIFIQVGGLIIISFGSILAMSILAHLRTSRSNGMDLDRPPDRIGSLVLAVVLTTLAIEFIGALLLMPMWDGDLSMGARLELSLFNSVSAFCNAGFALQSDNMVAYRHAVGIHLVMLVLVVLGGLGFPVLRDLWRIGFTALWRKGATRTRCAPLSLHTKLVLATTLLLYLYGTLTLATAQLKPSLNRALQQGQTSNQRQPPPLDIRRIGGVVADASFMSLAARTAGFNSMPIDQIEPAGRFVLMTLMMVGASPGGSGGGMMTTTLALLVLGITATLRRRNEAMAFGVRIDHALIQIAVSVAVCFFGLVCASTLLLALSEPYPLGKLLFEAISAASTSGLSLGITSGLTAFGKGVIIATMFLGRVGTLLLVGVVFCGHQKARAHTDGDETILMG